MARRGTENKAVGFCGIPELMDSCLAGVRKDSGQKGKRPAGLEITNFFKKFSKKALTNSLEKAKLKLVQELEIPNSFV